MRSTIISLCLACLATGACGGGGSDPSPQASPSCSSPEATSVSNPFFPPGLNPVKFGVLTRHSHRHGFTDATIVSDTQIVELYPPLAWRSSITAIASSAETTKASKPRSSS